jgi:ubiquinone/menaquinone biosynthesis C-methylase UbiE
MTMQYRWPKEPVALTTAQENAREAFVLAWHEELPGKYRLIESFNQGYPAKLPPVGGKTLEVGAGIGGHLGFEDLKVQEYHVLEFRAEFCDVLRTRLPADRVHHGDIEKRQEFPDATFDRVIAIHTLEHLRNLPAAVDEVVRILKPDGVFDVVLPCEGGIAYSLARKLSAERMFQKKYHMPYRPIIENEHVNTLAEVESVLKKSFTRQAAQYFPLGLPIAEINLCVGFRLTLSAKIN